MWLVVPRGVPVFVSVTGDDVLPLRRVSDRQRRARSSHGRGNRRPPVTLRRLVYTALNYSTVVLGSTCEWTGGPSSAVRSLHRRA